MTGGRGKQPSASRHPVTATIVATALERLLPGRTQGQQVGGRATTAVDAFHFRRQPEQRHQPIQGQLFQFLKGSEPDPLWCRHHGGQGRQHPCISGAGGNKRGEARQWNGRPVGNHLLTQLPQHLIQPDTVHRQWPLQHLLPMAAAQTGIPV